MPKRSAKYSQNQMAQLKLGPDQLQDLLIHRVDGSAGMALNVTWQLLDQRLVPHRRVEYRKFYVNLNVIRLRQIFLVAQYQQVH
jgi:hypothetical protein